MTTQRSLDLQSLWLEKGAHSPDSHFCVLEAVAFVAGERWTDSPSCASPVIATFLRSWNDALDDETRQSLKQYIPRLIDSKGTAAQERQRSFMAGGWLIRTNVTAWMRLAKLTEHAEKLAALPSITTVAALRDATPALNAARDAAWDATRAAAWDAARAAAWDAARDAAGAAAGTAAWGAARTAAGTAAWGAARTAAWDAAGAAAWDAAGAAAGAALEPTIRELQASAHLLLDRMLLVTGS